MTKAGYEECLRKMAEAAELWMRTGASEKMLLFQDIVPDNVALIAPLSSVIDDWGQNESSRSLLRAMDAASEHKATYMQARAVLQGLRERYLSGRGNPPS